MEERKVKESGKKRTADGCDWLDEAYTEKSFSGAGAGDYTLEKVLRLAELCKIGGSSTTTPTGAQDQGMASIKKGNTLTSKIVSK